MCNALSRCDFVMCKAGNLKVLQLEGGRGGDKLSVCVCVCVGGGGGGEEV